MLYNILTSSSTYSLHMMKALYSTRELLHKSLCINPLNTICVLTLIFCVQLFCRTPLERADTEEFRKKEARAERLASEIENVRS